MVHINIKIDSNVFVETNLVSLNYDGVILPLYPEAKQPQHITSFVETVHKLDKNVLGETTLWKCDHVSGKRIVFSPVAPATAYNDSRILYEASKSGMEKAIRSGVKRPLLILKDIIEFRDSELVIVLGALEASYIPLHVRAGSHQTVKFQRLGIYREKPDQAFLRIVRNAIALEIARVVTRDITNADPESMTPTKLVEYVRNTFQGDANIKINVLNDLNFIEQNYPLFHAASRASNKVERYKPTIIEIEYTPSDQSRITDTLMIVGKGLTFDTGGVDVKSGRMNSMSKSKAGCATAIGFFKACSVLKPPHLKVIGQMCVLRNSVGEDALVSDEIIKSKSGKLIRVGNTDFDGLIMADALHHLKERASKELNPHLYTFSNLSDHAKLTYGANYSVTVDNNNASANRHAFRLQASGAKMGDGFEISVLRPEDFNSSESVSESDDLVAYDFTQRAGKGCRRHQTAVAFLILASGLHDTNLKYTHLEVSSRDGNLPGKSNASALLALSHLHKLYL